MKKRVLVFVFLVTAVFLFGEGSQESDESQDRVYKIGLSQFVQHPALDAIAQGIKDEMAALGYDNVEYDEQNSSADVNTARQIATLFQSKKMDIVVGIATPNAQALKMAVTNAPVVYAGITDPVSAGLVETLEHGDPGMNGTSFKTPFKKELEFIGELHEIKVLGQVYSGNEDNAMFQAQQVQKACEELGIEYVGTAVASSAEVKAAAESLMGRVDAVYVTTDNTVVSALSGLAETANKYKVPVISADPASARENPVFIAWGFDWYYIGQETARIMDRILKGEKPEDMPTTVVSDPAFMEMIINTAVAEQIGIEIPQSILDDADEVITE